jgi:hypothetical protein
VYVKVALSRSRASVVGIVPSLWVTRPKNCGCIPARGKEVCPFSEASETSLGPAQPYMQWILEDLPKECSGRGVNVTTYPYLQPNLKMCGAIPPIPKYLHGLHKGCYGFYYQSCLSNSKYYEQVSTMIPV